MSEQIRLRRHHKGYFAVGLPGPLWLTSATPDVLHLSARGDDQECSGPGWSELLVAELPEPGPFDEDGGTSWTRSDNALVTMYVAGPERADLKLARQDALKELAAVAACEHYQKETH